MTRSKLPDRAIPTTSASSEFLAEMAGVVPLKNQNTIELKQPKSIVKRKIKSVEEMQNQRFIAIDFLLDVDVAASFVRNGIAPKVLRKLKRGFWPVCAELDLHGANSDQAQVLLNDLIFAERLNGICVRIIHGRALGSPHGSVLKRVTRAWLLAQKEVLAYCEAPAKQGGEGAVLVLLKNNFQE